eukprot:jgi/Bigna1/76149/fgenesh1_pg.39_\
MHEAMMEEYKTENDYGDTRNLRVWHLAAAVFMALQAGIINASNTISTLLYSICFSSVRRWLFDMGAAATAELVDADIPQAVSFPDRSMSRPTRANRHQTADHFASVLVAYCAPETFRSWVLKYKANPLRWLEYSVSASCMTVLLGALTGIYDVHILFMLGVATGICNLMGLIIEILPRHLLVPPGSSEGLKRPQTDPVSVGGVNLRTLVRGAGLMAFWFAALLLVCAFLVIICYFSQATPPDFVYIAFYGTIVAYATFAINMFLERFLGMYDFVRAEKVYIVLSFTAKTFLAWDVYGGFKAAEN